MNIEDLRKICLGLPHVTENIKWGHDLCFCIGEKMFCVTGIDGPLKVSLKVRDEEFHDMLARPSIVPAPYVARYKWVLIEEPYALNTKEWTHFINQSYELVRAGLPKKIAESLGKTKSEKKAGVKKTKAAKKQKPVKKQKKPTLKKNEEGKNKKRKK